MKHKANHLILSAKAILALIILSTIFYWTTSQREQKNSYVGISVLIREVEKVRPPSGAVLINEWSNHKMSTAIVSKRYKTALTQSQIFDYYKSGLESTGWSRIDGSGLISEYCKGVLRAGVEFNPDIGFYTFSITWRQRITAKCGT
jgi:hypothetical protein